MIVAIVQARMGSSRLPGKVLKKINNRPLLHYQMERIRAAGIFDEIVIATTFGAEDRVIWDWCREQKINCFRGSTKDVLDRYYRAAAWVGLHPEDTVVRLTADCPLLDPALIRRCVRCFQEQKCDYLSNNKPPTFPHGLDVEVMSCAALAEAWRDAVLPSEREHVTSYIYKHPEKFQLYNLRNDLDLSHIRVTVDEQEDLELVGRIIEALYAANPFFSMADMVSLLSKHPDWLLINNRFKRDEGYKRSLLEDEDFVKQRNENC